MLHLQMKKFDVLCQQSSCPILNHPDKSLIYESGSTLGRELLGYFLARAMF